MCQFEIKYLILYFCSYSDKHEDANATDEVLRNLTSVVVSADWPACFFCDCIVFILLTLDVLTSNVTLASFIVETFLVDFLS